MFTCMEYICSRVTTLFLFGNTCALMEIIKSIHIELFFSCAFFLQIYNLSRTGQHNSWAHYSRASVWCRWYAWCQSSIWDRYCSARCGTGAKATREEPLYMEWVRGNCVAHILVQADVVCTRQWVGIGVAIVVVVSVAVILAAAIEWWWDLIHCAVVMTKLYLWLFGVSLYITLAPIHWLCFHVSYVLFLLFFLNHHSTADIEGRVLRVDRISEPRQLQMHFPMKTSWRSIGYGTHATQLLSIAVLFCDYWRHNILCRYIHRRLRSVERIKRENTN